MVTTFGSYATAPRTSGALPDSFVSFMVAPPSEQRQAADRLADEVIEEIGRRSHDAGGARVAEESLDADFLAEGLAAAGAHGEIEHLVRRLTRHRLALEDAQHGVGAPRGRGGDGVVEQGG